MSINNKQQLFYNNHRACVGCNQIIAVKAVLKALGSDIIIINATGCLEVTTASYPTTAWGVPWLHSLFENPASVASGVLAALRAKKDKKTKVVVQAGDGSTFDIGFGAISGMWSRGEDILYICYDNESYANTGGQASGATPFGTKIPLSDQKNKKDMISLALAHNLKYVAQTTVGYLDDIEKKVKTALTITGPKYIQILCPCFPAWGIELANSIKAAKLANETGLYPLLEFIDGKLISQKSIKSKVHKVNTQQRPKVEEYLKLQNRFSKAIENKKTIEQIQKLADENIRKYHL